MESYIMIIPIFYYMKEILYENSHKKYEGQFANGMYHGWTAI